MISSLRLTEQFGHGIPILGVQVDIPHLVEWEVWSFLQTLRPLSMRTDSTL
jgi:hypothetical protein